MKTCPVCAAKAFDDVEVCYGCLHRFEEGETRARSAARSAERQNDMSCDAAEKSAAATAEQAAAPFTPIVAAPGGWAMRVEFCCGAPLPLFDDNGCSVSESARRCPAPRFSMTEDGFMVYVDQGGGASKPLSANRSSSRARAGAARAVLRRRRASCKEPMEAAELAEAVAEELEE